MEMFYFIAISLFLGQIKMTAYLSSSSTSDVLVGSFWSRSVLSGGKIGIGNGVICEMSSSSVVLVSVKHAIVDDPNVLDGMIGIIATFVICSNEAACSGSGGGGGDSDSGGVCGGDGIGVAEDSSVIANSCCSYSCCRCRSICSCCWSA